MTFLPCLITHSCVSKLVKIWHPCSCQGPANKLPNVSGLAHNLRDRLRDPLMVSNDKQSKFVDSD